MKFEYDTEVDILMVTLADVQGRRQRSERLPYGGVVLDLAEDGTLLAIEIMGASKKYALDELRGHPADYSEPLSLADASRISGISTQALRKASERGRLVAKKVGRDWTTTIAALHDYQASRLHEGHRTARIAV